MANYLTIVVGEKPLKQLEKYFIHFQVKKYIKYTKEDVIKIMKDELEVIKNDSYALYLENPEKYIKIYGDPLTNLHVNFLVNIFPKRLLLTDDELYEDFIFRHRLKKQDLGPNGEIYSRINPNGKWLWHQIGGKWSGFIKLKDLENPKINDVWDYKFHLENEKNLNVDQAKKCDIANIEEIIENTHALVINGEWFEKGEILNDFTIKNEKENGFWKNEIKELLADLPNDVTISLFECYL